MTILGIGFILVGIVYLAVSLLKKDIKSPKMDNMYIGIMVVSFVFATINSDYLIMIGIILIAISNIIMNVRGEEGEDEDDKLV